MQIYLDHSATTQPRSEAITMMQSVLAQHWGNPSSIHAWGQRATTVVERARLQIAQLLNAPPDAIVFTSGGTEADNLALMGIARHYPTPQHIIVSSVEHAAIAKPAALLENWGWQVSYLPVNAQGRVNPLDLEAAIQPNTVLVSIIYGQSEVGTLQPLESLAQIARYHGVLFHTDAVQVAGRLPLDVQHLPLDLLSLSAHKLYGPQGAGALYVRPGVELKPLFGGGGQEKQLRSGTQAVPTIAGFGVAAELAAAELTVETPRLMQLRDRLFELLASCPYLMPTGDRHYRLPHHLSFVLRDLPHVTGKEVVRQMNLAGIAISAGSACHSGQLSPSPVLRAMGYDPATAIQGIRLTLGRSTTRADIDWTAAVLQQILHRLAEQLCQSPRAYVYS
ncbi:MAG: cysteine desulfurase family protein [Cyanophyceae cyanobacterium]